MSRPRQVAVVSGKGGTGKTTVTASIAAVVGRAVTADCDVDAANLALLLPGEDGPAEPFFAGQRARVQVDQCDACGVCEEACRFGAVEVGAGGAAEVDLLACEGCAVCGAVCPTEAITMVPNRAGQLMVRRAAAGPLVHASLGIAQDNSGKLVAEVRERARAEAAAAELDLILIDGPPGIGCPVHAAVTGVDLLLAVTEPTPSGAHDLGRLLELARGFKLRAAVVINKADLSTGYAARVEALARDAGAPVVGWLPFDPEVPALLARRQTPLALPAWGQALRQSWQRALNLLPHQPGGDDADA